MRNRVFAPLAVLAMFAWSAYIYFQLPEQVPVHWNIAGEVDRYGSRWEAVVIFPFVALGLWGLLLVLPRIDPKRVAYASFQGSYQLIVNATLALLALVHVAITLSALRGTVDLVQLVPVGVGLLLAVIGNEMGRVRPNWFVGIRTPWTLADPDIWRKTHRVAGRVFVAAGLVIVLASLLLPIAVAIPVFLVCALGAAFGSVGYSYWIWRQRGTPSGHNRV